MITSEAAGFAITAAKGLIKVTNRVDLVLAEQVAVESRLPTIQPSMILDPPPEEMIPALESLLADTSTGQNDPIASDREQIRIALDDAGAGAQNVDILIGFMRKYLPEQALGEMIDLNSEVLLLIAGSRPEWDISDPDVRIAAFSICPGKDSRQKGYTWRLALTVVDVLAEFGAENTALFARDEQIQGIVRAILQRFAEADLETTESSSDLVRAILSATLNGALDAREFYDIEEDWLDALLNALQEGRKAANDSDEFLLNLLHGRGYPLLVGTLLEEAATRLAGDDAEVFENIAADVLRVAGDHFKRRTNFGGYLEEHWGGLMRASLNSLAAHGRELMANEKPIVQEVVVKVLERLGGTPNHKFFTDEMLAGMVDAAVGAVAANPEFLSGIDEDWLRELVTSIATTVAGQRVRTTFSRGGLTSIVAEALGTFAEHPELILEKPGLGQELLKGVLTKLSSLDRFNAEELANAAISGALKVLADKPALVDTRYPTLVATLAGKLGGFVADKSITRVQGREILSVMVESVAENAELFLEGQMKLASIIVDAVMDVSESENGRLIAGTVLVDVVGQVTEAAAVSARTALDKHPLGSLRARLTELLNAGLACAQEELGRELGASAVPQVLGGLVIAWARGEIDRVDPDAPEFQEMFSQLAARAAA